MLRRGALAWLGILASLTLLGAILLKLPAAAATHRPLTWGEAIFTASSATSLTGLTVRSTATGFSTFGQCIILALIQLGALALLVFGSFVAALMLGRLPHGNRAANRAESTNTLERDAMRTSARRLAVKVVLVTLAIEAVGVMALLGISFGAADGGTLGERLAASAFHAVSALTNAGFDVSGHSLIDHRYAASAHAVILPLIVLGGLGMPVLFEIGSRLRRRGGKPTRNTASKRKTPRALSTYARLVLATTAVLYVFGLLAIAGGQLTPHVYDWLGMGVTAHAEEAGALSVAGLARLLADSSFLALSARSAGFTTMPIDQLEPGGQLAVMALMLIGGSPASVAGGVKTAAVAALGLASLDALRRGTRLPRRFASWCLRLAGVVAAYLIGLIALGTYLLALSENFPLQKLLFEVISAATTTGLSLGITQHLTGFGWFVLIATMLLGRAGPLALVALGVARAWQRSEAPTGEDRGQIIALG